MREKAIAHIELHIKMLEEAKRYGRLSTLDFKQARLIGMIGLAKELELITTVEYLTYIEKTEI